MSVSAIETVRNDSEDGISVRGVLETSAGLIGYAQEIPHKSVHDRVIVLETGLGAGIKSLEGASKRFLELGCEVLRVEHTHHDRKHPIGHNAKDIDVAIKYFVPDHDRDIDLVGLSRGWPTQLLVAGEIPDRIKSLTGVAPAMMSPLMPNRLGKLSIEMARELVNNPREFGSVVLDSISTTVRRLDVTVAETALLTFGLVKSRISKLIELHPEIMMNILIFENDCFFDPVGVEKLVRDIGGFNELRHISRGGHCALAYDRTLVDEIHTMKNPK